MAALRGRAIFVGLKHWRVFSAKAAKHVYHAVSVAEELSQLFDVPVLVHLDTSLAVFTVC